MKRPDITPNGHCGGWQSFRRPKIDVDNGDGLIEVCEVSSEHQGGDWTDIGYFFRQEDAEMCALVPDFLQALEVVAAGGDPGALRRVAKAALKKAKYVFE